jgi:hypothetical protein
MSSSDLGPFEAVCTLRPALIQETWTLEVAWHHFELVPHQIAYEPKNIKWKRPAGADAAHRR